jgi:predicted TIM-barrel fold metal-dependent hydrolase
MLGLDASTQATIGALAAFKPRAMVRAPQTHVPRARTPAIDAHNHLGRWLSAWIGRAGEWVVDDVPALLDLMDAVNVAAIVNLDGRWGDELEANLDRYDRAHPGRFATFCHADWSQLAHGSAGVERIVASLRASRDAGARGLKVWKDLGLGVRDERDAFVAPDDPRLADVWSAAGDLGLPVLIHTADPVAFWEPLDARNERLDELTRHPEWWFGGGGFPSWERLLDALEHAVGAHRATTFIAAHVCSSAEDLARVDRLLRAHPNLHVDVSARIAELGRQPRGARALIERHPDRVLFGTDWFPPDRASFELHFRFLETLDECFAYGPDPEDPWPQGRWSISALGLDGPTLDAVYAGNARRLLGALGA